MSKYWVLIAPCVVLTAALNLRAGDLDPPPGPVSPTMKTLTEVEPRTAVQSLPGSETALHVISQSGSYYLTGNITGVSGKNGIEIAADNVTLDLTGFALIGVSGTLSAIHVPSVQKNLAVHNGNIVDWDGVVIAGLATATHCQVFDLQAYNSNGGINLGARSIIRECIINVFGTGVKVGSDSIVYGCTITSGGSIGISINGSNNVTIDKCTITNCGNDGIRVHGGSSRCVVRNCTVSDNTGDGITVDGASTFSVITGNYCDHNGTGPNLYRGIFVDGFGGRVEDNVCNFQDIGIQAGGLVVRNSATGNDTNYMIAGGVVSTDPATAGPWDNFSF